MDRLTALDVAFLELERPGPPLAVGVAAVLDGPCPDLADVRAMVTARLPDMPRLGEVLDSDHGGVRRQQWRPLPEGPDLEHHVRAARARDGDLDAVVSEAMARPLPHDLPLWDLTVVRGLASGRWAVVWRVHHAIADGFGAMMLLGNAFDLAPEGGSGTLTSALVAAPERRPTPRDAADAAAGPDPGGHADRGLADTVLGLAGDAAALVGGAAEHAASGVARLVGLVPQWARTARDTAPRPPGELSGPLGDTRRWEARAIPLADAKAIGRAFGTTVNDVVLAAVTTGYRALLLAHGEVAPDRHLRVMVPVSLRRPGDPASDNQVSAITVPLPVGQPDPVRRLHEIRGTTRRLKDVGAPVVGVALLGLVDALVPAAVQDFAVSHGTAVPEWFVESIVTNVPGPQFPLWVMGRRVRTLTPMIPLGGNIRLLVGVVSFDGDLDVGVTGDGASPDAVATVAAGIAAGMAELRELARG